MKLRYLSVKNFKSIRDTEVFDIEQVLILTGKNNTGKTVVLDAIRALNGSYAITSEDFNKQEKNISIGAILLFDEDDFKFLYEQGAVSKYKKYELWYNDFFTKLPFEENALSFTMVVNKSGKIKYIDKDNKINDYIKQVLPCIYHIDSERNFEKIQEDILLMQDDVWMSRFRNEKCLFSKRKNCKKCFECIGVIEKKSVHELNVFEAGRLFEYKLYHLKLNKFLENVNLCFKRNGGCGQDISYTIDFNPTDICKIRGYVSNKERGSITNLEKMSTGMKCIYILSLLEAYIYDKNRIPCIILMEDPEIFLHPQLQKVAGEILYRLSKKNQVIFSTHSPTMLFDFTSKQIKQVVLDGDGYSIIKNNEALDRILDSLGYSANDLMNVDFVFIVEGRQDKTRLPILLNKYYSEVYDSEGKPFRVAIITTNSCTNIKTYANLKYINQLYLKDRFLMIRDSDGKNPEEHIKKLCRYYDERSFNDIDKLPKVTRKNILILKYYSFENYFLNPKIMTEIGIIESEDDFYDILFQKWNEYLSKLNSAKVFLQKTHAEIKSAEDIKNNIEAFKIYMRGHNIFDIFYKKYRDRENEILKRYIEVAPKEEFKDIFEAIDRFIYFENRRKK